MYRKNYIKPILEIEEIEFEDLLTLSGGENDEIPAGGSDDEVDAGHALGRSDDFWDDEE